MDASSVTYIDDVDITKKKILLRVDFNVSLNPDFTIVDDLRIKQSLPTINYLLERKNKLIIVSHLGRPKMRDPQLSLKPVADDLQKYLPNYKVNLVDDFLNKEASKVLLDQKENEILVLENIRFYPEENENDGQFAQSLAGLADVYVNDAFGVSNRSHTSIVGITKCLPHYGGLLLKKEITIIGNAIQNPQKPFLAIVGGAKITDKLTLINRLTEIADDLIVGGGLANTFLLAQGFNVGKSLVDASNLDAVRRLFFMAAEKHTTIHLPTDVGVGQLQGNEKRIVKIEEVEQEDDILDIGPNTLTNFGALIAQAKTIIWNGPVGYFENPVFRAGTDFIFDEIVKNQNAVSIVGGGDTLAAIKNEGHLEKITHVSTGGGAMLEFIEKGTLPGVEALKKSA